MPVQTPLYFPLFHHIFAVGHVEVAVLTDVVGFVE
jgi:hypothetical protein